MTDRYGGTRIATNLRALLTSHHAEATRGAVVVIGSDGWDADPPAELAAVMARLSRRASNSLHIPVIAFGHHSLTRLGDHVSGDSVWRSRFEIVRRGRNATTATPAGRMTGETNMVRGERRWFTSALAAVGAFAASSTLVVVASSQPALATVPGLPGTPQPGTPIFTEDFSNESAAAAPIRIGSYTGSPGSVYVPGPGGSGADGETYTADPAWSPGAGACNGWIMRQTSPLPPNGGDPPVTNNDQCGRSDAWGRLQEMARDMGLFQGQSPGEAATNQVLTEYTNSVTGAQLPGYQLETDNNTIPAIGGHFYSVSAIFAERNCTVPSAQRARLRFELLLNGVPTVLAQNLSPCTDPGAEIVNNTWIAKLQSLALQLSVADTPTLGLRLYNATATGIGNDVAFDLPQIVDVTPQLDKAFNPTTIGQGQTSTLTFTITNTDDLQAKNGMSFTDTLPANVTATGVNSTTCSDATVTAPAGATSVDFAGNLDLNVASCTISIQVTSTVVGSYTNTGCVAPDGSTIPGCESNFPPSSGSTRPAPPPSPSSPLLTSLW